ncbi:MAG TPA: hypothetical protein VHO49_15375 [Anaerolineales bacterium]|nr:hypothetical protein [Anaerolineales bacterium]
MNTNRLPLILTLVNVLLLIAVLIQGRMIASDVPDVLRVRAFELVDEDGQVRAQFSVEESGEVVFRLRDEHGVIRVKLGASQEGSGLVLINDQTEPGVQILARPGETVLTLSEQGGEKQVIIEP